MQMRMRALVIARDEEPADRPERGLIGVETTKLLASIRGPLTNKYWSV